MRLATINSDIERLYKKYSDIKKKRLSKEKTQQILVNRIKYLKSEVNRSISKKKVKNEITTQKINKEIDGNYDDDDGIKAKHKVIKINF